MNKSHFTFFFLLVILPLSAQTDELIPVKKLKKDFSQVLNIISAHPAPLRHLTKEEWEVAVLEAKEKLSEPRSINEFIIVAKTLLAKIKDGHTRMGWPIGWAKDNRKKFGAFPYKIHLSNEDELYFLKHYAGDESIPKGSKILSINNVSVEDFLSRVDPLISYEIKEFRNAKIEDDFEHYLWLIFGDTSGLEVEYKSSSEGVHNIENLPLSEWKKYVKDDREEREKKIAIGQPYEYKQVKEGVGMISIYSFSVGDFSKYEFFLKKTFREIQKTGITSLIIDVRGNYGGYPKVASSILQYITDKHFKTMARSEMKVTEVYKRYFRELLPQGMDPNQTTFFESLHSINLNKLFNQPNGSFIFDEKLYNEPPSKPEFSYSGDTYLLIDRRSYSMSSSFAATFRCYQLGPIIGSETGGTRVFHANAMFGRLSNTRIPIWVSTTRNYTACYTKEDEGIIPDIDFTASPIDLMSGQDAQLNYTMFIIRKLNKAKAKAAEQGK